MCFLSTLFGDVGNCRLFVPKKVSGGGVFEPSLLAKLRHWILAGGSTEANASRDMAYDTAMFDRVPWVFFLGGFPDLVGWPGRNVGSQDLIPGWVVSTIFFDFHRYLLKMIRFDEPIFRWGW